MIIHLAEPADFSAEALSRLRRHGTVRLAEDAGRRSLLASLRDVDVLWVRLRHRIDAELMERAPRLKAIVSPTTGLDHIDVEEARRRGIDVLSLRGEVAFLRDVRATAEHTVALALALLRRLPAAADHVRGGGWDRDLFKGRELHGKTVGIVGYGRVGRLVARYLRPFDVRLAATDPYVGPGDVEPEVPLVPLGELLRTADLVSLHVALSADTEGLLGIAEFALMKPGAWLVNTSRGQLVDEAALLAALRSGRLAGAALDVLRHERASVAEDPLVAHAREHDNLILTPHIGGCTVESMAKTEEFLTEKLCREWLVGARAC